MYLFRSLRVDTIEEVLEAALVLIIREVYELLEFFFKAVTQETVVDAGHARYIDPDDAEVFHLLCRKPRSDQVDAATEPAVLWATLLKTNITACFQLGHKPVNVLL